MKKRIFGEHLIGLLRDAEAGVAVQDPCCRHGFREASHYLENEITRGGTMVSGTIFLIERLNHALSDA